MKKSFATLALAIVLTLTFGGLAFASTSNGTEFQSLYDRVIGWVTGLPAIIIAISVGILGIIRGFQTGSIVWPLAGILTGAFIFVLPTVISGLGGSTF